MTRPSSAVQPASVWKNLSEAADHGQLYLSAEAARKCDAACSAHLEQLELRRREAIQLATIDCYGDFESGKQLSKIYSEKIAGGENSLVEVLESHVQVVKEMQVVFRKFFVDYQDTEHNNSTAIGQAGPN